MKKRTDAAQKHVSIRRRLLAAYDTGKRDLPWRGETDPYRIWVSEIMLQQTRVDTVVPYYRAWMGRFPDIDALADADEEEVLRAWQGLGYYGRARRLHEGARVLRERFGGVLPRRSEELRKLPGIGDYTAGAVASIAFGEVVPAVDGNVRRVLSRLFDLTAPTPKDLWALADGLVDRARPGDFNQALMELGALTCLPRTPRCGDCPLGDECLARARGTVADRPAAKKRKAIPEVDMAVLVAVALDGEEGPHVLMRKRSDAGLLAGMWEFPGVDLASRPRGRGPSSPRGKEGWDAAAEIREAGRVLAGGLGIPLLETAFGNESELIFLEPITHGFSHLKVRYHPVLLLLDGFEPGAWEGKRPGGEGSRARWLTVADLDGIPTPVAQQKIWRLAQKVATDRRTL